MGILTQNIKNWFIQWLAIVFVLAVTWISYAAISIVSQGEELTAAKFNELIANVNSNSSNVSSLSQVMIFQDEKPSWTTWWTSTAWVWLTRTLNTTYGNIVWASLSSHQFTLPAWKYLVRFSAPAVFIRSHKAKIRNVDDNVDIALWDTTHSNETNYIPTYSRWEWIIDISSSKTFELQHKTETSLGTWDLGWLTSGLWVNEVYGRVVIQKLD